MILKNLRKIKGSVALLSILIISAVLIIAVVSTAEVQINTSKQHQNNLSDDSMYYVAEACMEEAMLRLERDNTYAFGNLLINDVNCSIAVVGSNPKDVTINVSYQNYSQTFNAQVSVENAGQVNNVELMSWEES